MVTTANTNKTKIYNLIILDESSSMYFIYNQALSGANETIQSIRTAQSQSDDQEYYLTFVTFNSDSSKESVRTIINAEPITNVKDLTKKDYSPNGCTPLYDAIGFSLTQLQKKVKGDDKVLVTIITDGMENSSEHFNHFQIKSMIERLSEESWTFVYIGANQDSISVAQSMKIDNAMNFMATDEDTDRMFKEVNRQRMSYYEKVRASKMRGETHYKDKEFFSKVSITNRVTPSRIDYLEHNEIFVFGSNVDGLHRGGAAAAAFNRFGAIWGCAEGMQGQSYAIPTVGCNINEIQQCIYRFIDYAINHPELNFLVTPIGCGNAGFSPEDIAPMFRDAVNVNNIYLPIDFWQVLM